MAFWSDCAVSLVDLALYCSHMHWHKLMLNPFMPTVLSTSLGKMFFCLAFYLQWKYFVLIDYILSETICLFCFCVLFSNMYPKIKFIAKSWSDLCNFYGKVIFWNFCLSKYFLISFAEFELLMFHNNIVKISEKLNKQNLLQNCFQFIFPTNFCIIFIHFYYGKKGKYWIF